MKTLYRKLINLVGKIPQDKLLHYIVGMLIFFIVYSPLKLCISNLTIPRTIAFMFVVLIALGKEYIIDEKWMKSKPDLKDAWATGFGGLTSLLISFIV